MALHNRVSRQELKDRIKQDPTPRTTISFYRYLPVIGPTELRNELYRRLSELGVLGRIYVAHEGINAQLSLPSENLDSLRTCLDSFAGLGDLRLNIAVDDDGKSFYVLDIKVRQ
jgi:UPF0176 protein